MQESNENSSNIKDNNITLDTDTTATAAADVSVSETKVSSEEMPVTTAANTAEAAVVETVSQNVDAVVSSAAATAGVAKKSFCTPAMKQYGIALLIVLIMGGALWYMLEEQGRVNTKVFATIKGWVMPEAAALEVNGERVPVSLYNRNLEQLTAQATAQGVPVTDEAALSELKKQSIDILINSTLLRQAAKEAGVSVTEEQIQTRYNAIVESQGGEEALTQRMAELKVTKDGLMNDIKEEILIKTHLDSAIDTSKIEITDADVEALYKSVSSNPAVTVPPLAEVRGQIEEEIRFGKEQELIAAYIETLKEKAKIEVLI